MRVPTGEVTVVLGSGLVRRRVMALLDESTGQGPDGRSARVRRVSAVPEDPVAGRLAALEAARDADLLLVDRLTDGLDPRRRREVLAAVRHVAGRAGGPAVLVDDTDPVAALAVADHTLRIDAERGPVLAPAVEDGPPDYLAS